MEYRPGAEWVDNRKLEHARETVRKDAAPQNRRERRQSAAASSGLPSSRQGEGVLADGGPLAQSSPVPARTRRSSVRFQSSLHYKTDSARWSYVRDVCLREARRLFGTEYTHAEDCAQEFVSFIWQDKRLEEDPISDQTELWIRFEAAAFVRRFEKRLKRAARNEAGTAADFRGDSDDDVIFDVPCDEPGPEPKSILSVLYQKVLDTAARLSAVQRLVWFGVYVAQKTIGQIAGETGRQAHLLSKALSDAKHRLQILLENDGTPWEVFEGAMCDMHRLWA